LTCDGLYKRTGGWVQIFISRLLGRIRWLGEELKTLDNGAASREHTLASALRLSSWKNEAKGELFDCANLSNRGWCNSINLLLPVDGIDGKQAGFDSQALISAAARYYDVGRLAGSRPRRSWCGGWQQETFRCYA